MRQLLRRRFLANSPILQSRLSRQVTAWVFFSILMIEGVLFVPSYGRRYGEKLKELETVSQEVLTSVKAEIVSNMAEQEMLSRVHLRENSVIKGVALHNADGQLVDSIGEAPNFSPEVFTQPTPQTIWQRLAPEQVIKFSAVRQLKAGSDHYDVAWPSDDPNMRYMLAIRHDASGVKKGMQRYILGVTCLVLIISAFVTWVTLLVLQRIVIRPLLLLRDDLSSVGDAVTQGYTPLFASLHDIPENELGEVSTAFREMFERIHQEIRDRTQAEAALRLEQAKADQLLRNILPEAIATRLKDNLSNRGAIAERFETATVLFADIVKFTELAAEVGPTQLVCQLNDIFTAFDAIAESHGLEKIKTIGDAYMVVGGVPSPQKNHAKAVMDMAIEMMRFAESYPLGDKRLCLRIGINTGPVVAGVIGSKKFSYDLWGDTVNVASRMESHGIVNRIQVSEETYQLLKENYAFEDRGYLPIKGRGEMRVFLLANRESIRESIDYFE